MLYKLNQKSRGFTLIELLVVVLILSILMAVALPLYLNASANAETKTCRANMQTIGNAVHSNYVATRASAYPLGAVTAAFISSSAPDLLAPPKCPSGGNYAIVAGTNNAPFNVTCDKHTRPYQYGIDTD